MFSGLIPGRVKENMLALAASPRFRDMVIRDYLSLFDTERQTQFAAMTFVYKKEFAYVGFRGTDTSITGWRENFNMAYTAPVPAQEQAVRYLQAVAQRAPQHEPLPWEDDPVFNDADEAEGDATSVFDLVGDGPLVHSLAHVPGLDEARTAAMLSDASIVAVYDFEVQESTAYLIMEYVEGVTLTELLHRHADRLTLDVVAAVFASVSHALEVAHANQVLHLDIKPDNVLINHQGQVKVTDFGLATLADASGYGAAGGGTIGYMPLEQMRQENLDVRCDEWALASLTYEMLAGENPFLAPDLERAEVAIEDAELVLPSLCWDELDPAVDDVIFFALDPDREERYATVADFAEELEPFLGDPKARRARALRHRRSRRR